MGLYACVDLSDLADNGDAFVDMANATITDLYEDHLNDLDSGTGQDEAGVQWDDMDTVYVDWDNPIDKIARVFQQTFMEKINELCPVRTGYLLSSIHCERSGDQIECYADADYAQYVEYGTYRMDPQPYFEPALRAAIDEAESEADNCLDKIIEDMEQEMIENATVACDSVGPSIAAVALAIFLLTLLLMMIYAICQIIKVSMKDFITAAFDDCLDIMIT